MRFVLPIVLCLCALPQDTQSRKLPKFKGTYILNIAGSECGQEEFSYDESGWASKGKYDIFGMQKGEFDVKLTRDKDSVKLESNRTDAKGQKLTTAEIKDGKFNTRTGDNGKDPLDLKDCPNPVMYADLVWSYLIDIGVILAEKANAGKLTAGEKLTACMIGYGIKFDIKSGEFSKHAQQLKDKPEKLWEFNIQLATVDVVMLCSKDGIPYKISVPAQQVEAVLQGYELALIPSAKPKTIVDSGEWREKLSAAKYEVSVEKKVMMQMRDGKKLAADIYKPKGEGKFPTVLARTPYRRIADGTMHGNYFARRGYVFVSQDVRGRFDSEGDWFPFCNESEDGSDTIDWIAAQPWSDGNVGMIGASYGGLVQWQAAKTGNKHLKAIVPEVAPPDPDQNIPYEGGVFTLATVWWGVALNSIDSGEGLPHLDWNKKLKVLPLSEIDTEFGIKHPFIDEWLSHAPTDSKYWEPYRYQHKYADMNLAVLNISGWFDGDQPGAPINFIGMRKAGHKDQFLVMGPWTHFFNTQRKLGDVDFGDEAIIDLDSVILRFFDKYLKSVDNGMEKEDPVYAFPMYENKWRQAKDWPIPNTLFTNLCMTGGGKANKRDGDGKLSLADDGKKDAVDTYKYDPADIPQVIGDFNDLSGDAITADNSILPDRDDELDYTSPPLAEPVVICGPVTATLSVSTDAADTDFCVSLFRVTPKGEMIAIIGGIQRLRYRDGKDEPVKPGEVVTVTVDCWATGIRLEKGERIRVVVNSWGFPGYARNLNTLDSPLTAKKIVIATNKVHRPSYVTIPVVGNGINFSK